jgi:hypothetical protein
MNNILLNDPDTFIQWRKTDEPGDNPKWESQCGYIEQTSFGDRPIFQGFVGPNQTPTQTKTSLISIKQEVERLFKKNYQLTWAYQD